MKLATLRNGTRDEDLATIAYASTCWMPMATVFSVPSTK